MEKAFENTFYIGNVQTNFALFKVAKSHTEWRKSVIRAESNESTYKKNEFCEFVYVRIRFCVDRFLIYTLRFLSHSIHLIHSHTHFENWRREFNLHQNQDSIRVSRQLKKTIYIGEMVFFLLLFRVPLNMRVVDKCGKDQRGGQWGFGRFFGHPIVCESPKKNFFLFNVRHTQTISTTKIQRNDTKRND